LVLASKRGDTHLNYKDMCNSLIMNDSVWYKKVTDNIEYYSYGCPDSRWDLETILGQLDLSSIKSPTIFVDTCCGIDLQEEISKTVVRNLHAVHPEKRLILLGCGVNYNKQYYEKYGLSLDNFEKFDIDRYPFKSIKRDVFTIPHEYGAIKIQDGCGHNCTYCIICKVRPHHTFSYAEIDRQIRTCINNGWTDILLFGTDICLYMYESHDLVDLIQHILNTFSEVTSIKLDSINPGYNRIYDLIDLIKSEPRLQKDLDLAIQSCSDTILKLVGRTHTFSDLKKIIEYAGNDIFIANQLITGLPGETEELFNENVKRIKELNPQLITLCPYSKRKGTKAAEAQDQVPHDIAQKREDILRKMFNTSEETSQSEFNAYKPDIKKDYCHVIYADIYTFDGFVKAYKECEKYYKTKDVVVVYKYDRDKSWHILEPNAKMLLVTFEAKLIADITIDDDLLENLKVEDFADYIPTFVNISFDKLKEKHNENKIINFFKAIKEYNLDDIKKVLRQFIEYGNIYQVNLRELLKQLNISLGEIVS
jgi:threonylcarbamoyladenosine tRNA methylthiotransferase MtaB